jgi:hypothetical protein
VGVTRRQHRAGPDTLARKLSRCKEGTAWFLQIQVQVLLKPGVSWYKFDRSREFIPGYKVGDGHWRSVAVQAVSEPKNCHVAGFILRAGERVRVHVLAGIVMGVGCSKNHDEPINYTVRVSISGQNLNPVIGNQIFLSFSLILHPFN